MSYKNMTAAEAAALINDGDVVGFSGFTPAGAPKVVPNAIAERAEAEHAAGRPFKIGMYTGASTGDMLDGALARANAVLFRTPYQSNKDLRTRINAQEAHYFDMHLSHEAQELRYGFLPRPKFAIVEACDLTDDGEIVPTSGVGILPTICRLADHIIVELNTTTPKALRGIHDIYEPQDPPMRQAIPVYRVSDRCGEPCVKVDPRKIVAVVESNVPNGGGKFAPIDDVTTKIGENVAHFLAAEIKAGRIPASFLPIQSGVGNIANAVLASLGENPDIPPFEMYTEVIQDAVIGLMKEGHVKFASGCSLTVSQPVLEDVYQNLDFFKQRIVLRPQEISNNPEVARRLGLITINTALEADIFGNINSTHVLGTKMMNGIGGSCDFTRNAYISIFTTPSTAKDGKISAIVPMVSHLDQSEHSVKVLITEYGVADLRGKSPIQRAHCIIDNCVHPDYRDMLRRYIESAPKAHTPMNIYTCFEMHKAFAETGDMHNAKL
ncbi:MAG: succinate CoA transferase [Paludibacteraceae bacterium]|nr:succinate CoA transferase [Bacteroidales bacterium]MCI7429841.1 succinate CoA transferase [Bacteroidales bacterium]MDY4512542.1 succinate CoA transferase [Paludibacteraceae bacterium]MDY4850582.1 succinate CoA transferase [Paludibacteraceae bacterium]